METILPEIANMKLLAKPAVHSDTDARITQLTQGSMHLTHPVTFLAYQNNPYIPHFFTQENR